MQEETKKQKFNVVNDSNNHPAYIIDEIGTILATSSDGNWKVVAGRKLTKELDIFITNLAHEPVEPLPYDPMVEFRAWRDSEKARTEAEEFTREAMRPLIFEKQEQ